MDGDIAAKPPVPAVSGADKPSGSDGKSQRPAFTAGHAVLSAYSRVSKPIDAHLQPQAQRDISVRRVGVFDTAQRKGSPRRTRRVHNTQQQ